MTTQSPYDRKITAAKAVVEEHNSNLDPTNSESRLSWDDILTNLKKMGGTTEETLREMTWEDLQDAGVPRILARRIANQIFRKNGDTKKRLTANRVATMTFFELFEAYDPHGEANPAVRKRLEEEAGGHRCVAFDPLDDTKVLAAESAKALRELKDGFSEQESVFVNKHLVKLFRVGETPDQFRSENFLFPGEMLRNGTCDRTRRDFSTIPLKAQQIVYLAITETDELVIDDIEAANRVLDTLDCAAIRYGCWHCDDPVGKAQVRYSRAALLLQDLLRTGEEPKLLLSVTTPQDTARSNDPFNTASHYRS